MAVTFRFDPEYGLRINADDGDELTDEQAKIAAIHKLALGMHSLADAMWDFREEFVGKDFYKKD